MAISLGKQAERSTCAGSEKRILIQVLFSFILKYVIFVNEGTFPLHSFKMVL
jgi:hypothetical protein